MNTVYQLLKKLHQKGCNNAILGKWIMLIKCSNLVTLRNCWTTSFPWVALVRTHWTERKKIETANLGVLMIVSMWNKIQLSDKGRINYIKGGDKCVREGLLPPNWPRYLTIPVFDIQSHLYPYKTHTYTFISIKALRSRLSWWVSACSIV